VTSASPARLPRPAPSPDGGPLDETLYDLVEGRFRRAIEDHPVTATFVGIHDADDRWGDASRDAVLAELAADRAHLAAIEALDAARLSGQARFERDLEAQVVRLGIFETEVVRTWERRSTAMDAIGDGLFVLLTREHAPLAERLAAIAGRLEGIPALLEGHRTRASGPQVRLWQRLELAAATDLPSLFDEIVAAGRTAPLSGVEQRRLETAVRCANAAVAEHTIAVRASLDGGTDDWTLGRERYEALIDLRAFDGLDADAILAIGEAQLVEQRAARVAAAAELDPGADEATVVDRVKSDHPATFEAALDAYREAMLEARAFIVERGLVTVPDDERLVVVPTPEYLRSVIPFAAYFDPPRFDPEPTGIYIVTPAVGDDPRAMREHYRASIHNTSIHEAYPGHHLQMAIGQRHPSLTRLMTDAPEFHEGWAMYCEQMMREEGFADGPADRLAMHTDAIWRACRIVLDVRMHRGEIGVDDAIRYLVERTGFEEPNARAEVVRYTYTPTYQLSYLLGKVMLLRLRDDERRRLGPAFDLGAFHDALLTGGSMPLSFHRRHILETSAAASAAAGRDR
jgi:uncharacterized protein (DUF885 family)